VMLLAPVPWASRVWALPFLSALAYSDEFCTPSALAVPRLTVTTVR
jgi:hypothetical protein